ncbi:sialate O-acetylesterase [Salmonirosea aquatica]|uniref:Sialate O-acetylesterase n=1 Tax=Salmonirosea aquatica TaxID=2654236 RepID=A0A7C9F555_9BACT|nr:sialate O-acetylesterase [Cytophagaceae bacterium SJW1-29]
MNQRFLKKLSGGCLGVLLAFYLTASAPTVPRKLDLILLIGQSNMAGRGKVDAASTPNNDQIWVMNAQNEWVMAHDPLHFDKPGIAGVGPGLAFAQKWLEINPKKNIGLIPCAVGGSGIDDWQVGAKHAQTGIFPYDAMLKRVKEAQKQGKIKAILWHQGESDSSPAKNKVYEAKLTEFFGRLRKDLHAPKTPIIMGTLGDFFVDKNPNAAQINEIITNYPKNHRQVYAVSSAGLIHKGDTTHFDTQSARDLGIRYAEKLWEIQKN